MTPWVPTNQTSSRRDSRCPVAHPFSYQTSLFSRTPPIPSNNEEREPIPKPIYQEVTEKYFKVFYREDAPSTSITHSLLEMDFEEKTSDLLALLTAHIRGFSLVIAVMPRPPTPTTARTSLAEATNKKRKHG